MIPDKDTNIVYISKFLKTKPEFVSTCNQITDILDKYHVSYYFLEGTKDIWARDYMPIQVSEKKFIEYRYDPDYLQGTEKGARDSKTYPDIVCDSLNLKTIKTDILLDGGNIVKSSDCVILTDKIVEENRLLCNKTELIGRLKELFEVDKVVLIPWDREIEYGHSDGMLRFIDNETVLIYEFYAEDKTLLKQLDKNGINWKVLKFNVKKADKRNWAYINFLQTKDLILIPKFENDEDDQALLQIKECFPEYDKRDRIHRVDMSKVILFGGALNCISWTIKKF